MIKYLLFGFSLSSHHDQFRHLFQWQRQMGSVDYSDLPIEPERLKHPS